MTFQAALPFAHSFRHAVDIGCRDGEFTRYLIPHFKHVYCFEPRQRRHFYVNVDTDRVTHFACALGDQHCEITMYGGTHDPAMNPNSFRVRCLTLDSFKLKDVDFIKVDVEGFEKKVLIGARETIERCRPLIVIEQNEVILAGEKPGEAIAWLEARGYRQVATCSRGWDRVMVPA